MLSIATDSTCCATSQSTSACSSAWSCRSRGRWAPRRRARGRRPSARRCRCRCPPPAAARRVTPWASPPGRFLLVFFCVDHVVTSVVALAAARDGAITWTLTWGSACGGNPHASPMNDRRLGPKLSMGHRLQWITGHDCRGHATAPIPDLPQVSSLKDPPTGGGGTINRIHPGRLPCLPFADGRVMATT